MIWPYGIVAVCVGTNKQKVKSEALRILKEKYGTGPVDRPAAMCSLPITSDDILIQKISVVE